MTFQTFTGCEYLKIDIANNYGLDKLTWDERIAWFDANEPMLDQLLTSAKEPALFYAGIKAWRDVKAGQPIGYMISLDATASGLQLLAALTGDRRASELCNVVDTGTRQDGYTIVYNEMLNAIGETAKITREDTKQAIMTALYSSTAVPKRVFGEGQLLAIFYETLQTLAPAAWELNEAFLTMWNPDAHSHDWVLPDNFHAKIKVMSQVKDTVHFLNEPFDVHYNVNQPASEGRSLGANTIHSIDGMIVREMTRRCDYDPAKIKALKGLLTLPRNLHGQRTATQKDRLVIALWKHYQESGYLSARILNEIELDNLGHIDPAAITDLLGSLPKKPFKVVSVHDCFRCLPHYGNDLRAQYNLQLTLIAQSNLLQYLISQLLGKSIQIGKLDPTLHLDIPHTNYALS
jgi:hypothetical protein